MRILFCTVACTLKVLIETLAIVFSERGGEIADRNGGVGGDAQPRPPTDDDAGEWARNLEAIPGAEGPATLRLKVEASDGRVGDSREVNGTGFCAVDGSARAVGSEDGRMPGIEDALKTEQSLRTAVRAGATHGRVAEKLKDACDEFTIEALADDDGGVGAAVVVGTGQNTLVPETVDFAAWSETVKGGRNAFVGDDFKSPGATERVEKEPDEARDDGQQDALTEVEWAGGTPGHKLDCTRGGDGFAARADWRDQMGSAITQPAHHLRKSGALAVHEDADAIEARGEPQRGKDAHAQQRDGDAELP